MAYGLTVADVERSISYFYAGLGNLISTNKVKIEIDNYEYEIEIPSSMVGNISYDVFGDYNQFLSGILLFNKDTLNLIDQYMSENPEGIYIPRISPNQKLKFIVNPSLKVADEGIVQEGANPRLESLAAAPLFDGTDKSVAEVHYTTGFTSINTDGNSYYFTVSAAVAKNKNVTLVAREVNKVVEQYLNSDNFKQYGSGYQVTFEGENEEILSAVKDLALAGLVAILLVYMIMAIQFQSLLYPFIILITIPLAFTGGMVGLLIANMNLSIVSIMGLIILVGVVVNNGIVLVDYINHLIAEGKKVKDALIEAGLTRLRPILMTALTTIFGLVTMALGMGEGAELLQPMAVSTIGGLIYATFLTLTIVPTVYALFNHKRMKLEEEEN
ncbi:MAG TPA: efflux RND transporter permease subunit [Acholeplasmataceae bacterium]|nr:efflux RND transporter permease subunit [Acholeplasmataceae bacterium]